MVARTRLAAGRHDVGVTLNDWLDDRVHHDLRKPNVLGWAWATVDLERALTEAREHATRPWSPVEDELLGATGLRLFDADPAVFLLEPSTEGRLAGWLARNGEGEAAVYLEAAGALQLARMTALNRAGRVKSAEPGPSTQSRLEILVMSPAIPSEAGQERSGT